MNTSQKIIKYIGEHKQASGKELSDYIPHITPRAIRKQLKKLFEKGILTKVGKPPQVFYLLAVNHTHPSPVTPIKSVQNIINERYLFVTAKGESIYGWSGFVAWCNKTKQDPSKTAKEYIATLRRYDSLKTQGIINGLPKIQKTFAKVFLDKLFYLDFYSIERFGKTKLGQLLLYAKQSQSIPLIHQLTDQIRPQIMRIIKKYKVDGVLFIPPTVKREIQLMKELEKRLNLSVRKISATKIKTEIIVPQKTLSKLEDRVENAQYTIIVSDKHKFANILIIDDAVGSGATLNETARQIKAKGFVSGKIIGLAITGSFKGFDVISEV